MMQFNYLCFTLIDVDQGDLLATILRDLGFLSWSNVEDFQTAILAYISPCQRPTLWVPFGKVQTSVARQYPSHRAFHQESN